MMPSRLRRSLFAAAAVVTILVVAGWPVESRSGLNYTYSSVRMPLYEKVIDFASRDLQTRRLLAGIIDGAPSDEAKLIAIFNWVRARVQPTPAGFPVVDDHPLHIIIRGYGQDDQRTEAFAVLASYAGMPSTAATLRASGGQPLIVAASASHDRLYIADVVNGVMFRDAGGHLADVDRMLADPTIVPASAAGLMVHGISYDSYFVSLPSFQPNFSRMELQKPWSRLAAEAARLFGHL